MRGGSARHGRGRLHRAAAPGRLLPVRRPAARAGAGARDDGLRARAPRQAAARCRAGTAAGCRCRPSWPTPCCAARPTPSRALRRRRRCRGPAAARSAAALVALPDAGRRCWPRRCARARASTCSCIRSRAAGAPGPGQPARLARSRAARRRTFSIAVNDYGFELLSRRAASTGRALRRSGAARHRSDLLDDVLGQPQRRRAGAAALPRDRAGRRGWCSRAIRARREQHASCRPRRPVLRGVPQARPRQPAAGAGRARGAAQELDVDRLGAALDRIAQRPLERLASNGRRPSPFAADRAPAREGQTEKLATGSSGCCAIWSGRRGADGGASAGRRSLIGFRSRGKRRRPGTAWRIHGRTGPLDRQPATSTVPVRRRRVPRARRPRPRCRPAAAARCRRHRSADRGRACRPRPV